MTFDEQLKEAFDALTARLRDEIDRQIQAAMDELAASARAETGAAAAAAAAAIETARAEKDAALADAAAKIETARAETDAAVADAAAKIETARAETDAAVADAATKIETARAETDAAVADAAAKIEAARAETAAAVAAAAAAIEAPPKRAEAVDIQPIADGAAEERFVESIHAIDRARSLTEILDALIASVAHGGTGAGVWLVRGGQLQHWRSAGIDAPPAGVSLDDPRALAEAARTNAPALGDDGFAVPLALAGQVVAVVLAISPAGGPEGTGSQSPSPQVPSPHVSGGGSQVANPQAPAPSPHMIEVLGRYAARSLEVLTAFKVARAMTEPAAASSASAQTPGEAEDHVAAQRYARLLVSEIKLYHEEAVLEGRRDRDLATRLGGEIARARVMYEQRVPPAIRQQADHFHDELVRTLADGDPSLLELRT